MKSPQKERKRNTQRKKKVIKKINGNEKKITLNKGNVNRNREKLGLLKKKK